jgi:hypothetical protein
MIGTYIATVGIILAVTLGWVLVQHAARVYAARHPEFGPAKEEGAGCGKTCGCSLVQRAACHFRKNEE